MRVRPEVIHDHFHVLQIRPIGPNVAWLEFKALTVGVVVHGLRGALGASCYAEVPLVGNPGPHGFLSADVQLAKTPGLSLHFGYVGDPQSIIVFSPSIDRTSAVDHGQFALGR